MELDFILLLEFTDYAKSYSLIIFCILLMMQFQVYRYKSFL